MTLTKNSPVLMVLAMLSTLLASTGALQARSIDEGIEYKIVSPVVPTDTGDKIEVVELFWYMCPHCYHAEPEIIAWKKTLPKNVVFKRVPAVFNQDWIFHARVFYTAEALGVLEKIHSPLFNAIHKHNKKINSIAAMAQFFKQVAGTDPVQFDETFNSFGVDALVRRAIDLSKRYQADGVPTFIVNGKYRTDGPMGGGHKGMMEVVQFLVDKETHKK